MSDWLHGNHAMHKLIAQTERVRQKH